MADKLLIIIGAGGHGKVAAECAESMGIYQKIVFLDAGASERTSVGPWDIVGMPEDFERYLSGNSEFFVAIGDNQARAKWLTGLDECKAPIASLIHASATISDYSTLGVGSLLCAHAVVNPFTSIGLGCIVNTSASIDHDCVLDNFVHIAPGCHIAGTVKVGEKSFIGIGSSVVQSVNIGKNCVLGAGSVVVGDIKDNSLGYGVPAKIIKTLEK
ncbi:acetyltransferase [Paraglaciecola aquimarina]|uniref:Acetyltransferase n=1 Tax=Paraglaciecola algarum TaxID=3050085 RepID=A0ABS9D433_9ALTE|nr:acetyltransferase [Paraglaciecola sp. G1-23]